MANNYLTMLAPDCHYSIFKQSCYMLDHCIGPSCLAYTIFTIAFHALMSQQCSVELYHASHMASLLNNLILLPYKAAWTLSLKL